MATTPLVIRNNRITNYAYLDSSVAAVAVDTSVNELFSLPVGFGDLWISHCTVFFSALSGSKVDSTHQTEGTYVRILSSDSSQTVDIVGAGRWAAWSGIALRPAMVFCVELYRHTLMRQDNLLSVTASVLAGAGVTATFGVNVVGIRQRQA